MKLEQFRRAIKTVESAIKSLEDAKEERAPRITFQPWDMFNDQYNILYYPQGKHGQPVMYCRISYAEALKIIASLPGDILCNISMGLCMEWLFVFHYLDGRKDYTAEQNSRHLKDYLRTHPELEYLITTEDGKEMRKVLADIPQNAIVKLQHLQDALSAAKHSQEV